MTLDPKAPQPAPAPALTPDQLATMRIAMFMLVVDAPQRVDAIADAYDAPDAVTLKDAAAALRVRLSGAEKRITEMYNTLAALGL